MIEAGMKQATDIPVEGILRDELAHGDVVLGTIGPIMGHLLANHDHSLFSDEIVSRVRGMTTDVARQLLLIHAEASGNPDPRGFASQQAAMLAEHLANHPPFLCHCHALALESQLAQRLERRSAIDPVLSPLLQALIASDESATASVAMAALAAQARFNQQQRRMELPLGELPGDLFHHALLSLDGFLAHHGTSNSPEAHQALRGKYDESASRLGLMTRLVMAMGNGAQVALSVGHAGVALFLTTLAIASHQDRDLAVISTNDRQLARLALGLRAAGLKPKEVEEQFAYLHPEVSLPDGFDQLRSDRAAAMLASSRSTSSSWQVG
ncbi:MAG: hypothetical protein IE933_02190 [Sphingomonadales bacterium]|nr:hypothetical protein [Sphingomonadales bacterium]MBD3772223.1 hypothetical protein [Paracoccaceae bacterium]